MVWEVLSRGPEPTASRAELFRVAGELGLLSELEAVCRGVALRRIAGFPSELGSRAFFINVSPNIIGDPRLMNEYMLAELTDLGLDQRNFVIKFTERESIVPPRHSPSCVVAKLPAPSIGKEARDATIVPRGLRSKGGRPAGVD